MQAKASSRTRETTRCVGLRLMFHHCTTGLGQLSRGRGCAEAVHRTSAHRWPGLDCAVARAAVRWSNSRAPARLSSTSARLRSPGATAPAGAASIAASVNQQPSSSRLHQGAAPGIAQESGCGPPAAPALMLDPGVGYHPAGPAGMETGCSSTPLCS